MGTFLGNRLEISFRFPSAASEPGFAQISTIADGVEIFGDTNPFNDVTGMSVDVGADFISLRATEPGVILAADFNGIVFRDVDGTIPRITGAELAFSDFGHSSDDVQIASDGNEVRINNEGLFQFGDEAALFRFSFEEAPVQPLPAQPPAQPLPAQPLPVQPQPVLPASQFSGVEDAKRVAYLYEAALGRFPELGLDRLPEVEGLNYWIGQRQQGLSEIALADEFLRSGEFIRRFGDPDLKNNREFTEVLYSNVLSREGDKPGIDYWTAQVDQGLSRQQLLIEFAISAENKAFSVEVERLTQRSDGFWIFVPDPDLNDVITGTSGNDVLRGLGGDDQLRGLDGDDILEGGFGSDLIDGGNGFDRAFYIGRSDEFDYDGTPNRLIVSDVRGTDTLFNIEALRFDNGSFTPAELLAGGGPGPRAFDPAADGPIEDALLF